MTSPSSQPQLVHPPNPIQGRTRPLKILLYSSDGYTESSVPALCLLMAIKGLLLPEAYLELQVEKRRSFFIHQSESARISRRWEVARLSMRMVRGWYRHMYRCEEAFGPGLVLRRRLCLRRALGFLGLYYLALRL